MQHVAMIMDGNRRWARKNAFEAVVRGHEQGVETVKKSVEWCIEKGIQYLSLYAFSVENAQRSEQEKSQLFSLMASALKKQAKELQEQGVSVRFIGDRSLFPSMLHQEIESIESLTEHGQVLHVQVLFFYGAQQELVYAARSLAQKVKEGALQPESITVDALKASLWTAGIPDPEMVIRPGGHTRLSNFLLYQTAYSEWFFLDELWPEINKTHLNACYDRFNSIQRNFGK